MKTRFAGDFVFMNSTVHPNLYDRYTQKCLFGLCVNMIRFCIYSVFSGWNFVHRNTHGLGKNLALLLQCDRQPVRRNLKRAKQDGGSAIVT